MKKYLRVFLFIGIVFLVTSVWGEGIARSQVLLEIATTTPGG